MNKLIILSVVVGGFMFAGIHGESDNSINKSNIEKYSWESSSDEFKSEAGRRRGKGNRGRRRGGGGLR